MSQTEQEWGHWHVCRNAVEVPIQPHEPSAKVDFHHFIYRAQWKTSKLNIVNDYNTSIIVYILFM